MRKSVPLALVIAMTGSAAFAATPLSAWTALKDFDLIVQGNATTTSDIEGAAIIGGNFSGATDYLHPNGVVLPTGYGALTVYGNTSGNGINVNNSGNVYVGGTKGASISFNGGHYLSTVPNTLADFDKTYASLTSFSTALSTLAVTSTLPTTGNDEVIKATPNSKGIAIFDITAMQLDSIPSYKINLNGASTVIFNVSGTTVNFNANAEALTSSSSVTTPADNIIWNFYNATTVNFGTQIAGSVLAPLANVTNNNQIDGTLVAKTFTGRGEVHEYAFSGVDPLPMPEPSTWAMMVIGLGGVGAALRRSRREGRTVLAE
jgi:choice-of-anchor A domain-containing protein